jgi:hypothetical protein
MMQPDLSEFKGGWNQFPSPIRENGLDVDDALLGDLQAVAFLLLEVTGDVKRETIICRSHRKYPSPPGIMLPAESAIGARYCTSVVNGLFAERVRIAPVVETRAGINSHLPRIAFLSAGILT